MPNDRMPSINFTLSPRAVEGIKDLWREHDLAFPDDPAAFPGISWGMHHLKNGAVYGNVVVGFYGKSQEEEMRPYLQRIGDLDLIYFLADEFVSKLAGAIIDYRKEHGFFLRDPVTGAENWLPQDVTGSP